MLKAIAGSFKFILLKLEQIDSALPFYYPISTILFFMMAIIDLLYYRYLEKITSDKLCRRSSVNQEISFVIALISDQEARFNNNGR